MAHFIPLPTPPQPQGLQSSTFKQPPLDGTLTVPEMYDWHLKHSPDHPLFVYQDGNGQVRTVKWREAVHATHRAGRLLGKFVEGSPGAVSGDKPLVAILANSDMITFWTVLAGLLRAGYAPFAISPRNSSGAVAHLITQTQARYLIVGQDKNMQELTAAAFGILEGTNVPLPHMTTMPAFEDLYNGASFEPLPAIKPDLAEIVLVSHSSGSTAYPKPIRWTFLRQLCTARTPCYGELDLAGTTMAVHANPMYHGMGIVQLGIPAACGLVLSTFKPQSPAIVPTPELMFKAALATKVDYIFTVPSFVEVWASDPEYVTAMKSLKALLWGGGPLSKIVGEQLSSEGIKSFIAYGLTELGLLSVFIPKDFQEEWDYFRISRDCRLELLPVGNGHVQLIIPSYGPQIPSVVNTKINGVDAYDTNDILAPHPTKPGLWKIYGRADDQIMHSTGEKTNPGPLETILQRDPHVDACVMFGRGRFNAGVIVDPKPELRFDAKDGALLSEYRNLIWPTIEKMNEYAPQHSRIFKEMIMVSTPEKPFTYTAKNTLRRQAIINEYEDEINALYDAVEESNQPDIIPPSTWTFAHTTEFVRNVVTRVMDSSVNDRNDIFYQGCDSLQATWIRNSLLHALKSTDVNVRRMPSNFVYQHPTVISLAEFIFELIHGGKNGSGPEGQIKEMLGMVEKYTDNFPVHRGEGHQPSSDVYLVTGTTGGLGCALLAYLPTLSHVSRVYAINRAGKIPLPKRQDSALQDRGYDVRKVMGSGKVVLVEAAVEELQLGIPSALYDEIRKTVTHIVHNAWPVNFNWSLSSFEPSVRGVRSLVDLALSSPHPDPPRILFTSSVGVLADVDVSQSFKEIPVEPSVAVGSGYSESKWVSEKLLEAVATETPVHTVSIRLGQLCGSRNGAWNTADWLPSLIKSSVYLKCLPALDKEISWIPVDAAARAVTEMIASDVSPLHLLHPRPVSWTSIMEPVAHALGLPMVTYDEWIERLEKSGEGLSADEEVEVMRQNPALKIMETFIRAKMAPESCREAMGIPSLATTQAERVSPSLSPEHLPSLKADDALQWVKYWQKVGFL